MELTASVYGGDAMNKKFFSLPQEKQQSILNAGYRVFSANSYKKSPVREIAEAAGISKSLLFHYFQNKRELYLFLWETCTRITLDQLQKSGCYETEDLFEAMRRGLLAKAEIMRCYPHMGAFAVRACYERDSEVCDALQRSIAHHASFQTNARRLRLDPSRFAPGLDLRLMYQNMYLATEGYLWEKQQCGSIDVDEMVKDFNELIDFWQQIYQKREE